MEEPASSAGAGQEVGRTSKITLGGAATKNRSLANPITGGQLKTGKVLQGSKGTQGEKGEKSNFATIFVLARPHCGRGGLRLSVRADTAS